MKVSLNWLKEYLSISLPHSDLAQKLTMAGLEVKGVEIIGDQWENIVVGQLTAINPHPDADRLHLATVDLGTEQATVVCGAPNLHPDDKIAFARVGAQLIAGRGKELVRLKPVKIRGIISNGMVCSEKELGISDKHDGIAILPIDAPVGVPLATYLGNTILHMEVTPNRPDCLSVIGIAREITALTGQNLHLPEINYEETMPSAEQSVAVEIHAPDLCPRYCASLLTNVKVAESPSWLQQRLLACGMRPINNIVDITNYVMLEYGQPLHAFDYNLIRGKRIIVRRTTSNEKIVTLDGTNRLLSKDMLVIADAERSVAVAGVMGGANSEVAPGTTTILLESANFNPASIHYTGRTLGLPSEACMRFERGISAELALPALKRATQLMTQLAGGKAAQGWVDIYPGKREQKPILLSTTEVKRILGIEFSLDRIIDVLVSLGFNCQRVPIKNRGSAEVIVTAPYWRSDIRLAIDLIDEIIRITGYNQISTPMTSGFNPPIPRQSPEPLTGLKRQVRNRLAGYGFQEIMTYSLTSLDMLNKLLPEPHPLEPRLLRVTNPITAEQEYLRPNLRSGLLATLSANRKYEEGGIRLFELGRVYLARPKDLPEEKETLCGILNGSRLAKSWHGDDQQFDFFDAKGVVEDLLNRFAIEANFEPYSDANLHPSRQAVIVVAGEQIGIVGELHPQIAENFEISGATYLFEIDLIALLPFTLRNRVFQPVPRFPAVVRDMALVLGTEITHRQVQDTIKGFPLVSQVALFDVYVGEQVPQGKKSLAYRITFQSPTQTLTDDEVNHVLKQILEKLSQEFGAILRA